MFAKRICFVFSLVFFSTLFITAQELKLEEIISKHNTAIGKPEKRKDLKNMVLLGQSEFHSKLPERRSLGKVAIVSDAANLLFISSFLSDNYPHEKIGFFEGKPNVPLVTAGLRSPLGNFLWEHSTILKSGLFSGSMSLHWSFLEENLKKGKPILSGTKKVDGRKAYMIEYFTEGTSDSLKIRLFFDTETFQHFRTEYREEFSGKEQTFGTLGQLNGYEVELIETFSDFKTYQDITLPSISKVRYMGSSSKGTYEYDWVFKLNEVKFNQPLKDGFFTF